MSEQLTEGERTVLGELLNLGQRVPTYHLANSLKQGEERIISILNSLATRNLVKIHTKEIVTYLLTDEGKKYADSGLPEVLLFNGVKDLGGKATFDDAVAQSGLDPKTKGIAMNWTQRNGWLQISKEGGTSVLSTVVENPESELGDALVQLSSGKEALSQTYTDSIRQALERKLISEKTTKIIETETVSSKIVEIEKLLSVGVEGIGVLTQEMISSGAWKGKLFRPYNVESIPPITNRGKKHPYAEFNDWLKEILVGMGFTEWFGPYVETEFWNNDTLFVPQDHVAREVQDQFRVGEPYSHGMIIDKKYYNAVKSVHENGGDTGSIGWESPFSEEIAKRLCLRAHTTPVSMRYLWEHRDSPQKMFIVDRNFRSENLSTRHAQEFNQCEGIIMDKGLTLRDLMGYLSTICHRVGIKKIKFKPGQFPFTEPSVECFAKHDTLGWIEVAPGGIFRPEVTRPLGITDSVLAWGIGSGRLFMAAMGIGDIRDLYSRDLTWLREKYFVR
ncbi:phenylalanine--tRNA ligase subunit alpha [Candidatus Thorarchaeota archaeon]|nr:MAG: phenylalanine--tRNA ligase subunit alpha [Candidatus Thorarchaeota archaeon]